MKKYDVIANDDAMKYQVIDTKSSRYKVMFEDDGESEAKEICELMNEAFEEGLKESSKQRTVCPCSTVDSNCTERRMTMRKYVEVDMSNLEDVKNACETVDNLVKNGYEIELTQKIGDRDCYGIHLKK